MSDDEEWFLDGFCVNCWRPLDDDADGGLCDDCIDMLNQPCPPIANPLVFMGYNE